MPAKVELTWVPTGLRWRKVVDGKVLVVSVRQLVKLGYVPHGTPATKEATRAAANRWLADTLAALPPKQPTDPVIAELERRRAWKVAQGRSDSTEQFWVETVRDMRAEGMHNSIIEAVTQDAFPVWHDRTRSTRQEASTDQTVGHWIAQFLELRDVEVNAGQLKRDTYQQTKWALDAFSKWLSPTAPVAAITAEKWVDWYRHVQGSGKASWSKTKLFSYPKTFCLWLIEQGLIPHFEALRAKRYKFATSRKDKGFMDVARLREILAGTKGVLRLHLLLCLNCGMLQMDISDLHPSEYEGDRIFRGRSKMAHKANSRAVSWLLWDETRELIERHKSADLDHLLLNSHGLPWVRGNRTDGIRMLARNAGIPESIRQFRAAAGNQIKKKFGVEIRDHFLAHKQRSVDSAYSAREQEDLDNAIIWWGQKLFR